MLRSRKNSIIFAAVISGGIFFCNSFFVAGAQTRLTYPEINTALQTKLPNQSFKNKAALINWIIVQVKKRKVDKALTQDREDDLRQAGATDELIAIIRANSPVLAVQTPTPIPTVVDLGELAGRAVNLVKPEYTAEARKAGTSGEVKLSLELDTGGIVVSVSRLTVLPNGLTERAVEAARQSTFIPAKIDGKPARGSGILTYNFKINLINIAAVMATADVLRNKPDCDAAIPEYTRVIDADSKHSKAFFGRGKCYLLKANYDRAAIDLEAAALSDPTDAEALFYLAIAHDFMGDSVTAATYYGKTLNLRPQLDKRSMMECLYIERRQMTPDQARSAANGIINACSRLLRSAPEFISSLIYVKRGIGYRLKSDFDKAIADFEMVRRTNPQFTAVLTQLHSTYNSRGLMHFDKKEYEKAFDDITTAINLNPQSPTPYINRCVLYLYARKEFDQAINDCNAAIRLSTKSSMAYVHRGYAYELKSNLDAAIADYKKALEVDPRNQAAKTNLNRAQSPRLKN
ncbi:MAG: tetratricopeptide repeat protein [Pyrinomonadaceae bacterium]